MRDLYRVKIDSRQVRPDQQKDGYLAMNGKIMEYTRGIAIKKAHFFNGKAQKAPAKVVAMKTYKLWVVIEEHTEFTDGSDDHSNLEGIDETASIGEFESIEAAREFMESLHTMYGGK